MLGENGLLIPQVKRRETRRRWWSQHRIQLSSAKQGVSLSVRVGRGGRISIHLHPYLGVDILTGWDVSKGTGIPTEAVSCSPVVTLSSVVLRLLRSGKLEILLIISCSKVELQWCAVIEWHSWNDASLILGNRFNWAVRIVVKDPYLIFDIFVGYAINQLYPTKLGKHRQQCWLRTRGGNVANSQSIVTPNVSRSLGVVRICLSIGSCRAICTSVTNCGWCRSII